MSDATPLRADEGRLEALKQEALQRGRVTGDGVRAAGGPLPPATPSTGYYGTPLFHEPTWTWEVPLYFFIGGAAGASAIIGLAADMHGLKKLSRDARLVAAAGSMISGALLVSDLGRPARFLYMLRVFKWRSPMSVGAWTLSSFGAASGMAALAILIERPSTGRAVRFLGNGAAAVSALSGAVMTTYTGVLVGATVIPAWAKSIGTLPPHFGASGVASGVSILELAGNGEKALNRLALLAAAAETGAAIHLATRTDRSLQPLKMGMTGALTNAGAILSGPVPLALRILGGQSPRARRLAAVSSLAGSLLTRFAWVAAGRVSSRHSAIPLKLENSGSEKKVIESGSHEITPRKP